MKTVAVLGSVNMDMVLITNRIPQVGESIIGEKIEYFVGGKGANQAVAASRAGGKVSFLGKVGDDAFGNRILSHLGQEALDLTRVEITKDSATGIASIFKLPDDNCIVAIPGANGLVDEDYLKKIEEKIKASDILLLQLEVPIPTVKQVLELAKEHQVLTILNPAPYHEAALEMLTDVDYVTPNETEFAMLLGKELIPDEELDDYLLEWQEKHATKILLTRGKDGVSFVAEGKVETIPGYQVTVADTTGAGDTFNGVFAAELGKGRDLREAVTYANAAAGLSVTKLGAQTGMPTEEEIEGFIKS